MKYINYTLFSTVALFSLSAIAAERYEVTITNGGQMPLSPPLLYVAHEPAAGARIGELASPGFTQICLSGNLTLRQEELRKQSSVKSIVTGAGPVLPGSSQTFIVPVNRPGRESIYLESMYGLSKDTCASAQIGSHSLTALKVRASNQVTVRDNVVVSGAFLSSRLPTDPYNRYDICAQQNQAVACLRELAGPETDNSRNKVRFASQLLPSVIHFLEEKYGTDQVQNLLIPQAGAAQITAKIIH